MLNHLRIACLALAVVFSSSLFLNANAAEVTKPVMVADEIIVKFKSGVDPTALKTILTNHNLKQLQNFKNINAKHLKLLSSTNLPALIKLLRKLPEVEFAEPNYYRYINVVPNDASFVFQYGLDNQGQSGSTVDADIDAPEAWDISTGSKDVVVAIIDSGIDLTHEDLADNLYVNPGEIPGNGIDDDANGFIDDVNGWDFVNNDNDPSDTAASCGGHGIHTAGTVGAVGNNSVGVTGVAQQVSIMPLRTFRTQLFIFCSSDDAALISAINYADLMGVDISNNSWGGGPFSQAMYNAIARARHLFVAAAGNETNNNDTNPSYPGSYDIEHIMSVAASDNHDQIASFSNFGTLSVDLAAPGVQILSTLNNGTYGALSGTSMAAPHVAGAAAVLLSADPSLTAHELKFRLNSGTDAKGLPVIDGGRLNLFNSLTLPESPVEISLVNAGLSSLSSGDSFSIDVTITNTSATSRTFTAAGRFWAPFGVLPYIGPGTISLNSGQSYNTTVTGIVPANAPSGSYRFVGRVNDSGNTYFDEAQILLEVN